MLGVQNTPIAIKNSLRNPTYESVRRLRMWCKLQPRENLYKLWQNSHLNSPKNDTCRWYDDTQLCKISCLNSTSFVRYKNNKFLTNYLDSFLAWNLLFYISQTQSSLDKIFYKIVYHHIIYMCDFFGEFRWFFYHSLHGFSQSCGLHKLRSLL